MQTGPYNKAYTESQLLAGRGFILPDFNEEQASLKIHPKTRIYGLKLHSIILGPPATNVSVYMKYVFAD